jgi:hypothetical protein
MKARRIRIRIARRHASGGIAGPLSTLWLLAGAVLVALVIGSPVRAASPPAPDVAPHFVEPPSLGWTQIDEVDGIVVETQTPDGGQAPLYRARGVLAAPIGQILEVLHDSATAAEWIPDLAFEAVVDQRSDFERVTRSVYAVPFPFADRELVLRSRLALDRTRGDLVAEAVSVDHPLAPAAGDRVRAHMACSRTRLRPLGPNRTAIEFLMQVDPGGRIPGFLAAFGLRPAPLRFVKALERRAQTAGYPLRPVYRELLRELQTLGPAARPEGRQTNLAKEE